MTMKTGGYAGTVLLLVVLVAVLAGAVVFRGQAKDIGAVRDEVQVLRHEAKVLDMKAEALVGALANLRVERNVLREKQEKLAVRSDEMSVALSKALEDLSAVRKERDEHLARRLDLARRLEDALSLIATLQGG